MKQFLKTIFSRTERCKKKGHVEWTRYRKGYYPGGLRAVVTRVIQKATVCKRCGEQLSDWKIVRTSSIQSFSAPESDWD